MTSSMPGNLKEVLFVGYGAVGTMYSLIIKRSGLARVTAVARGNYDIVNDQGIQFNSRKYGNIRGWKPDRLCKSVSDAADREYSYVVVTTKAIPELTKTSQLLSPFLSLGYNAKFRQPTYVLMQNGLNVEVELFNALAELQIQGVLKEVPRIISGALWIAANLREQSVVDHGGWDDVLLGAYRHQDFTTEINTTEEEGLLQDFARIIEAGGGAVTVVPEIQRTKFAKNIWNVTFATFATLTGYPLPAIFRAPPDSEDPTASYTPFMSPITADLITQHTLPVFRRTLEEMLAVGRALGFPDSPDGLPSSVAEATMTRARGIYQKADSFHIPSMLLDVQNRRPIEVEVIVGEVVRMAHARGVEIPRIELMYSMLLVIQNQLLAGSKL